MRKSIRIETRDFAIFLKEKLDYIIDEPNTTEMEQLANIFNNTIKSISDNYYGYYWKDEDGELGYWKPSTAVAIKTIRKIFGLQKTENILVLPQSVLGWWLDELKDFKSPRSNSLCRDRWRNRGKALKSIPLYNRHLPGVIYLD